MKVFEFEREEEFISGSCQKSIEYEVNNLCSTFTTNCCWMGAEIRENKTEGCPGLSLGFIP